MRHRFGPLLLLSLVDCTLPHARAPLSDGSISDGALAEGSLDDAAIDVTDDRADDVRADDVRADVATDTETMDVSRPDADAATLDATDAADVQPDRPSLPDSAPDALPDASVPPSIALYNYTDGNLRFVARNGALMRGGPLDRRSVTTEVTRDNFMGVSNNRLYLLDPAGFAVRYLVPTDMNDAFDYEDVGRRPTLRYNALNNTELRPTGSTPPQFLGATDGRFVYAATVMSGTSEVLRAIQYSANDNHGFNYLENWATFSNGGLDGDRPERGIGLLDFSGNTDILNNFVVNVESDGTLEYYWLGTGNRDNGLSNGVGNWSTLRNGPLAGLTLRELSTSASGSFGGFRYRYFGMSEAWLYFELTPE
jgi:hypothetical protein